MTAVPDGRGLVRSVLEEEREFFVRSLRDLEAERAAGDIDDGDYRSLRDDYTVRAAEVIRQLSALDGGPAGAAGDGAVLEAPAPSTSLAAPAGVLRRRRPPSGAPVAQAGDPGSHGGASDGGASDGGASDGGASDGASDGNTRIVSPWRRRVFIGAAVLIVAGGIAFAVNGMSGSSLSAATRVKNLDVAALDAQGSQQYEKALQDYEAALKIQPTDVLTLTGEGELLVGMGSDGSRTLLNLGLTRLQSAEIANPSYGPAFGARGIGLYDKGDYAAAIPQFETYLADTPKAKRAPAIQKALTAAEKRVAAKPS